MIESVAARVAVGQPGSPRFEPYAEAIVAGRAGRFPLGRPRRQVDIHALQRQNVLFSADEPALTGRLRSAIDLVAPMETAAPGTAIAGGWAALEAVLASCAFQGGCSDGGQADPAALLGDRAAIDNDTMTLA